MIQACFPSSAFIITKKEEALDFKKATLSLENFRGNQNNKFLNAVPRVGNRLNCHRGGDNLWGACRP